MPSTQESKLLRLQGLELRLLQQMADEDGRTRMAFLKEMIRREATARGLLKNPYVVEVRRGDEGLLTRAESADQQGA